MSEQKRELIPVTGGLVYAEYWEKIPGKKVQLVIIVNSLPTELCPILLAFAAVHQPSFDRGSLLIRCSPVEWKQFLELVDRTVVKEAAGE